jgi:hypothetical protein
VAAASALHGVAERYPGTARAMSLLINQLRVWPQQDESLNGFLIDYLVDLHAVGAAPLMQAAFVAGMAGPTSVATGKTCRSSWDCWRSG